MSYLSINEAFTITDCQSKYFDLYAGGPSGKTVGLSFLIIILTINLEIWSHFNAGLGGKKKKSSTPNFESTDVESSSPDASQTEQPLSNSEAEPSKFGHPDPPPNVRANRLAIATVLVIPLCVAFGFLIDDKKVPYIEHRCLKYLRLDDIYPNWVLITFLNIIPFVFGCTAWLRTLVDCLLVRKGKTLGYMQKKNEWGWPPCAPLLIPVYVIAAIFAAFVQLAICVMGSPDMGVKKDDHDIELGEEEQRLVDHVDCDDEGNSEEPPAYDASWRAGEEGEEQSSEQMKSSK